VCVYLFVCMYECMYVSIYVCLFVCSFAAGTPPTCDIKLGSAELSAPAKVGDETTNLFSPLEKSQRGIH
jgi:hypothetical protein